MGSVSPSSSPPVLGMCSETAAQRRRIFSPRNSACFVLKRLTDQRAEETARMQGSRGLTPWCLLRIRRDATLGSVLGGARRMWAITFSGDAHWLRSFGDCDDLSAITTSPALAFQRDLRYLPVILTAPVAVLITVPIMVSVFYRMKIFTIYEYLERRYGIVLRVLASILFLTMRGGWLATAIFVPSLALSVVANATDGLHRHRPVRYLHAAVGGFKGVIWRDASSSSSWSAAC